MKKDKVAKIKSLNDEVNEFHPVLNELFVRLNNIQHVEYTHGNNEMGADFVLTKIDNTLSRTDYIGVIVKTGKIGQNNSALDTQIKQCEINRKIEGGKKKIFLTEIWVVTNSSISPNAERIIHQNYANKNIKFINGQHVTVLINDYYPEYWTDVSIHIGNFLRSVIDKSTTINTNIDLLDISSHSDIYVKQELIKLSNQIHYDPGRNKPPKRYQIQSILDNDKLIFVEGTMGTGKSKLLTRMVEEYSTSEAFNTTCTVPFILTFKEYLADFKSNFTSVIDFIDKKIQVEDKNYLILIDSLDELNLDEAGKVTLLENIYQTANQKKGCKVIVTSRPLDNPDTDTAIDKYFSRYSLIPLTIKQIVDLVDTICGGGMDTGNNLIKELEKSHLFKVLPKTPISAIILAKLLNNNIQEIPSTMTELYSKYTELVLGRWDVDRGLQSQIEYDVQRNVVLNIAKYLLDYELDTVSVGEVYDMFEKYITSRKVKVNKSELFHKMISNPEIFRYNSNCKTISFIHRTFAEYFYACCIDRDNKANIDQDMYKLYWSNVYFFYYGLKKDCPELVQALHKISITEDEATIAQIFMNGNLLLAAYLTPYDIIEESIIKSYEKAGRLFDDIINNRTSSVLTILPKIPVLSIFTHQISSTYGYELFIEALESRSLDLTTINNPSDAQYAELFLINSTLLSISKFNSFDVMVKKYGDKIPQVLQAGIQHSVNNKTVSPVVKRHVKSHKKKVQNNKSLRDSIIEMYQEPIDAKAALEFQVE